METGVEAMDITGASGAIPRTDNVRMDAHAERYYEEIRKRNTDVATISQNTGFSVEDVEKIKRHVFIDTHDLGNEELERFIPIYDMAVSWQRLIDGKAIQEMDIILLRHELAESAYMAQGMNYDTAHRLAETEYNYTKYIKELEAKEGLF